MKHVLYIRNDGALVARIEALAERVRAQTRERVTAASIARRLLWAALESPQMRRRMGLPANS